MSKEVNVPDPTDARHPNLSNRRAGSSRGWQWIVVALAAVTLAPATGCKNFRNLAVREAVMISYRDMVWARRAYNLRYGNCNRPYGSHFENGFCSGYSDVCNGGDGYVPAMPPTDYRTYQYQSAEGVQCVNAWFEGYPAGVAAARQEKVGNYNDVLISKMIDSAVTQERNTKTALPTNVPIVGNNGKNQQTQPVPAVRQNSANPATTMTTPYGYGSQNPSSYAPSYAPRPTDSAPRAMPASRFNSSSTPPPIVTGSGVDPQANNTPLPEKIQQVSYESARRTR